MAGGTPTQGAWISWATGVLNGIGAPATQNNYDTLWAWSKKESGGSPMSNGSILNNPLATTQKAAGSVSGNSAGVQSYPDVTSSVTATVQTLTNGLYPNILTSFRNNVPASQWSTTARYDLDTWAHGPNGAHGTSYPNFLGGAAGGAPTPGNPGTLTSNPVQDAINSALGPIGTAITGAEQNFVQAATNYFLMGVGVLFMLGGLALIAVMTVKVPGPVEQVAETAAAVTPVGRAAVVAKAATPKAAPTAAAAPAPKSVAAPQTRAERGAELEKGMSEGRSFGQLRRKPA
jgi:hypothetical protein